MSTEANEVIQVFGNAIEGNFDSRTFFKVFCREYAKTYSSANLTLIGETGTGPYKIGLPVTNGDDLKIVATDAVVTSSSPYTQIQPRYFTSSYGRDVDIVGTPRQFGIVIDVGTHSGIDGVANIGSTIFTSSQGGITGSNYTAGSLTIHNGANKGLYTISGTPTNEGFITVTSPFPATETGESFTLQRSSAVVASSPAGAALVSGCDFTSDGTGHAIEVTGTAADFTLTNNTYTGYGADGTTDAAIFVNIASGTAIVISITGGDTPTIRTAGVAVTVQNAVTIKITVRDANTLVAIPDARVLLEAGSVATGTHTGSNDVGTLTDGSQSFTPSALVGYRIYNTTDGSDGLITANDATTVTATLSGGTGNDWDTSDAYIIVAKPALNPVSIASVTTTATVTHRNHGLINGASVVIRGATEDEYNGIFTISNVTTNTYDYTLPADPTGSSANGSPTATAVFLSGVTGDGTPDPVGILQTTSFNYIIDQPITGKVRRATTGDLYKTGAITGTITSAGLNTTILLILDE